MDTPPPVLDSADLTRRLREAEAELARVTLRLRRLEDSASVQLAQLLTAAARNPRENLPHLPRAAAGIVRRRRKPKPGAAAAKAAAPRAAAAARGAAVGAPAAERLPDRLLAASAVLVATRDRPVLAVVADAGTARAWAADAHVQLLRPDDAPAVFAAVTADVLVVDAAAGQGGPWLGLGTYAVPERDRTVLELLRAARDRGVPAVLVPPDTQQEAPMLDDARPLFAGSAARGAGVGDLLTAGRGQA
jgi:hypothetical protein